MNSRYKAVTCAFGIALSAGLHAQQSRVPAVTGLPPGAREAAASIDPEKIRAHVRFLSLDLLEGRGPGTRGGELAAEYIATQFALAGLQPAGDNGTYFQRVPLVAVHTIEDKTQFSFVPANGQSIDLKYGDDIVVKDETGQPQADFDAPIVFIGYGIDAPEYHWNDAAAWIQHPVAQKLFDTAGLGDLDQAIERAGKPGFHAVELPIHLKAHIESRVRRYVSANIVGRVAGASSGSNAVLYTAHYDHLGIDPNASGDNIYNGAADNGTGCGILMEMARAFAQSPQKPPHDVYFASVTAEEQGLLGSQFLGMHPPVPARQFTLDLNYDMLLPIGIPLSVNLGGAERINFWPAVQHAARDFDLEILPDPEPMAGFYYRSDHFSLARVGIPSFSIDEGDLFEGHDLAWGRAQMEDYNAHHYHQPSDEYHADWDFRADAKLARFGFALGWLAGERPNSIEWNAGDEFETARKKSEGAQ